MAPVNISFSGWKPDSETTRRMALVLVFIILVLGILTACGSPPSAVQPESVSIIVTGTSAEPLPVLPKPVEDQIISLAQQSTAPGGAVVRVIGSGGGSITEEDATPVRGNGAIEHATSAREKRIRQTVDQVNHQLTATTANRPGLNLLPFLDRASTFPSSRIAVISSGLSTEAPMDFRTLGFDGQPDKVIDSIERQGQLPNLSGHHVTFYGLGGVQGSQPTLPPFARSAVEKLWLHLCQRAKADGCAVTHDGMSDEQPR